MIKFLGNYGWPISSYGEHYTKDGKKDKLKYDAAPLYKSHEKYGFIAEIKVNLKFLKLENFGILFLCY